MRPTLEFLSFMRPEPVYAIANVITLVHMKVLSSTDAEASGTNKGSLAVMLICATGGSMSKQTVTLNRRERRTRMENL